MIDLKNNTWLLILGAGILALLAIVLPSMSSINIKYLDETTFTWISGLEMNLTDIGWITDENVIVIGVIGSIVIGILAFICISLAILTKAKDVKIPFKGYVWLGLGLIIFILPFIIPIIMVLVAEEATHVYYLRLPIDLFSLFLYSGGFMCILAGLEEIRR
ncbi:MAG: hypothetical protein EU544_06570 [Promethearchaeota archaeon]|nr:MAG: hypothetical protein EU544_06570 [Candidatus Lokiarchaeota archaeon]